MFSHAIGYPRAYVGFGDQWDPARLPGDVARLSFGRAKDELAELQRRAEERPKAIPVPLDQIRFGTQVYGATTKARYVSDWEAIELSKYGVSRTWSHGFGPCWPLFPMKANRCTAGAC